MEELEKLFEDKNIESKFYGYNDRNVDEITEKIEQSIKNNAFCMRYFLFANLNLYNLSRRVIKK